jgi:hypothetical protein
VHLYVLPHDGHFRLLEDLLDAVGNLLSDTCGGGAGTRMGSRSASVPLIGVQCASDGRD